MKSTLDHFLAPPSSTNSAPLHITDEAEACAAVLMACLRANELDSDSENATFYTTIRNRNIFKGHDPELLIAAAAQYYEQVGSPSRLIDAAISGANACSFVLSLFGCYFDRWSGNTAGTPRFSVFEREI
jgi:hypothetical protein